MAAPAVDQVGEQRGAQVALAERRDDHDDESCRRSPGGWPPAWPPRRRHPRRCRRAGPPRWPPAARWRRRRRRRPGRSRRRSSVSRISGTKPAPMPWIGCGPLAPPESTGEAAGSTATICTDGLRSLSTWPTPVIVPPVPTPDDDDVDGAVGVVPDLLGRGAAVDLGVGRVRELLRHEVLRVALGELLGPGDRARHALGPRGEDQLGAVGAQQGPPLLAHRLGHRQHDRDASRRADHGQRDAGVAAGGLDDDGVRADEAGGLCRVDHADADAVLDAVGRVEELQLGQDGGPSPVGDLVQTDERGVADQLGDVVGDAHGVAANLPRTGRGSDDGRLPRVVRGSWETPRGAPVVPGSAGG